MTNFKIPKIRVQRRPNPSKKTQIIALALSLLLAFFTIAILFFVLGVDPLYAFVRIIRGGFGSVFGIAETISKAIPLTLAGIGLTIAFRARIYNIGAEGQFLIGAIVASGIALEFPDLPAIILLPAMFIGGFLGGALWGIVPAILKTRLRVDEVLTSLMMVYIAIEAVNYLIYGPWKGPGELGFPITSEFSYAARIPRIETTRIHYPTVIIAILLAVLVYLIIERTRIGYEIRVTGENPEAAKFAGMNYHKIVLLVMSLSGGLAGLAGVGEVAGIHYRLRHPAGISPGYGFTAIIVAWLARLNPIAAIVSAFLFGGLLVGGDAIQIALRLPAAIIYIFNGVILFFVIGGEILTRYKISVEA
jgi:simple sugar transport system permease protein